MNQIMLTLLALFISLTACNSSDDSDPGQGSEQLYSNGQIYTVNPNQEWAEAMLVRDGIIVAIGGNDEVQAQASVNAETIDLQNRMVLPGLHDVHVHALEAASDNFQFTLDQTETNPEMYATSIQKALDENTSAEWILGWGFDIYTLFEATREPIEILNDISATKPIAIMEQTSHSVWVNAKALELAEIDGQSPNPTGGIIMKGANGQPNGLLIDNAGNLIIDLAIASISNSEQSDYEGLVNFALPELAKNGITSICDARTYWKRNHHLTWQRVADEGLLTTRTNLGLWIYPTEENDQQISTLQSLYTNDPESLLKTNQIKLYADGIIINTTAAMQDDYLLDLFNLGANKGLNYVTENSIAQYISALEPIGFDFHIHALGNRGVNEALNAIEQSGSSSGRHRLTHIEYVLPSDYERFGQLNVTADAQVAGDFTQPDQWHENDELIGTGLNNANIPLKSLHQASARITLSSDWDVSSLNPFVGLQNAVTRSPQEIALAEAIKAYTLNAAYVMRQEDKVGSLEQGKEADFIILSQSLFDISTDQINRTQVLETYLQGRRIYQH